MGNSGQNSGMPIAAGILLIIAGILALIVWIATAFVFSILGFGMSMVTGYEGFAAALMMCGVIGILLSIITLLGGIFAVQKKKWGFALAASIIGLFTIGFYFISSILSLIALILIAISRQEFNGLQRVESSPDRRCPNCGRPIPMDALVCPYCGKKF